MSGRLFKKVLKEQEHQFQQLHEIDDEEELNESHSKSSINPFDLLNDQDSHQDDESEIVDETLEVSIDEEVQQQKQQPFQLKSNDKKLKKKKKKKNKAGKESSSIADKAKKSLDVQLGSLSLKGNSSGPSNGKSESAKVFRNDAKKCLPLVLQVDPKYLNVENELRRIFGSKVVKSFERRNPAGTSRQVRGGRRAAHHNRKTNLVSPSEHWPRWDGSFSMEFVESKNGRQYFRYVHSSSYYQAQRAFEAAKAIHDLNGIASILVYLPYHLDSLTTMAEYFKFVGEHQASADAVAMCLYALECAWHPTFTPFQDNCQLKFSEETNKPLFTALFAHMRNLDRRGCHRSALEVCKLLLSLDSDDPMGALFCVDYYALRAEEYAWLEQFSEHYKTDIWLFPNFSYSLPICQLYLERVNDSQLDPIKSSSIDIMKQALMLHPSVLKKLVAKVPLKDQVWTRILQNSFFGSEETTIPSLDHLINIYVERSYLVWRLPDVQKLLREAALSVLETLEHGRDDTKDWACVRKEAFSYEKNEYGHLLVQDFSDLVPFLPPDNLQNFMMVDPRMMEGGVHIEDQNANPLEGSDIANRNPLAVLIESMLPWVHYEDDDNFVEADKDSTHANDHG